jgi:hypothetical protein
MAVRVLAGALALLSVSAGGAALAGAAEFRFEGGSVEVPPGFIGPMEQRRGDDLVMYAFTKRHPVRGTATLMQISVFRPPPGDPSATAGEGDGMRMAEKCVREFVEGVERRRTDFSRGDVESVAIDGRAVARISWRGRLQGEPMRGVMYCHIRGPLGISFHAQDFEFSPPGDIAAVVRAFETASFAEAPGTTTAPAR